LVELGADTTCFVRYNSRNDLGLLERLPGKVAKNIRIVSGDLKDEDAVRKVVNGQNLIFHLGALISIPHSYNSPRDYVQTNILGTLNILTAALDNSKLEKLIQVSSSEVYGTAVKVPIDERHPLQSQSPYSATKIGADKLAISFYLSFGLPVSIIRPFNTYGPGQSARAVIPTVVTQLLKNQKIKIGNLKPIRDFLYVSDTVQGFVSLAASDKAVGEEINVGSGVGVSIKDLVAKISRVTGLKPVLMVEKKRIRPSKSEVFKLICDNSKAKKILSWQPKVSLERGLSLTVEWIKDNQDFYKTASYQM
jgi:NAD dependent epimerase/dehydratase